MVFQNSSAWSHSTSPQPNAAISQTPELVSSAHIFQSFVQQGFLSGGYVQVAQTEEYLNQNSPNYVINPSVAPVAQIYVRHNLLDGFGVALNSRSIRVAKAGIVRSQETFREQLLTLVANVVNLYWGLVSANDDAEKARQHTRDTARKFLEDTRHEVEARRGRRGSRSPRLKRSFRRAPRRPPSRRPASVSRNSCLRM